MIKNRKDRPTAIRMVLPFAFRHWRKQPWLGSGLALEGFYEYYLTSRFSVRTGLGWANPSFDREEDDSLRLFRVAIDVAHNWEGGTMHPFVGGGAGICDDANLRAGKPGDEAVAELFEGFHAQAPFSVRTIEGACQTAGFFVGTRSCSPNSGTG